MTTPVSDDRSVVQRILDHIDHRTTDLSEATWREPVEHYRSRGALRGRAGAGPAPVSDAVLPVRRAARDRLVRRARRRRHADPRRARQRRPGARVPQRLPPPRHAARGRARDARRRSSAAITAGPTASTASCDTCRTSTASRVSTRRRGDSSRSRRSSDTASCSSRRTRRALPGIGLDDLPELIAPGLRLLGTSEIEVPANWKIVVEGFLEGYHIRPTHRETFYPVQFDNLNVVETFGRNSRIAFPYRASTSCAPSRRRSGRADGVLTYVYHLFPNAMVATFPTNVVMVVLEPLADRSHQVPSPTR